MKVLAEVQTTPERTFVRLYFSDPRLRLAKLSAGSLTLRHETWKILKPLLEDNFSYTEKEILPEDFKLG